MIPEAPQSLRQIRTIGRDHATFSSGQVLYRMETERRHMRNLPDLSPLKLRA